MRRGLVALVAVSAVAVGASPRAVLNAQKPERRQEVKIPGFDLSLKAGWQLLFNEKCRFAVPGSWRANEDGGLATAPDGSNLSIWMFKIPSWSAHKGQILAAFGGRDHVRVHEDGDRRLWFEIGDPPRVQHVIDVAIGPAVCSGLLELRNATTLTGDDVNRIADSIGPAPSQWPPDARQ